MQPFRPRDVDVAVHRRHLHQRQNDSRTSCTLCEYGGRSGWPSTKIACGHFCYAVRSGIADNAGFPASRTKHTTRSHAARPPPPACLQRRIIQLFHRLKNASMSTWKWSRHRSPGYRDLGAGWDCVIQGYSPRPGARARPRLYDRSAAQAVTPPPISAFERLDHRAR